MIKPEIPENEKERLETLRSLKILDSGPEERYDRLTRLAQRLFNVSIVTISLIDKDRQWFKSIQGSDAKESARELSFCAHAINSKGLMIVNDALKDKRFHDNPLVTGEPNIRFYAGYPIETRNKMKMGTLCLIDHKPRSLSPIEVQLLKNLGQLVEKEITKFDETITVELFGEAEDRFFLRVLQSVMEFARGMNFSIGMLIVHAPESMSSEDGSHVPDAKTIMEISRIITNSVRLSDLVNSLGSDAFYIFLPKCDEPGLKNVLDRISKKLSQVEAKIPCIPKYKFRYRHFVWTPNDPQTVDDLVSRGLNMLEDARLE